MTTNSNLQNPFVSCICITRDRSDWLPTAIDCFISQTYTPRELIICYDEDSPRPYLTPSQHSWTLSSYPGATILITVPYPGIPKPYDGSAYPYGFSNVADKRNYANYFATGSILCHWDDDDWSEPARISQQVQSLLSNPFAVVTGYRDMLFTTGSDFYQYAGTPGYIVGTSLCYYSDYWRNHPFSSYPHSPAGEDFKFLNDIPYPQRVSVSDSSRIMYATAHTRNTSPRPLTGFPASWAKIDRPEWYADHPAFERIAKREFADQNVNRNVRG